MILRSKPSATRLNPTRTFHTPQKNARQTKIRIWIGILLLVCLSLGILSVFRFFRVTKIDCREGMKPCTERDLDVLSMYQDRSIFSDMKPTILGKNVAIKKRYPQTLLVDLSRLDVLGRVYISEAKNRFATIYADATVVIEEEPPLSTSSAELRMTDLTLQTRTESTVLPQEQVSMYTGLLELSKRIRIDEIIIRSPQEIEIHTERKLIAIVSTADLDRQLRSLQLLLESPTIEQKPARVDLRFEKPVLQYYE